jgi:HD-GYP domain-containing protein (c-di-GMP phosphodiesterase class II)
MLRTIDVQSLLPGMYVNRLLGPWMQHPFWRSSFLIDREDIAKLHASVVSRVVIDTARGLDVPTGTTDEPEDAPRQEPAPEAVDEAPPEEQTAPEIVDIGNEIAIALRIREDGRQFVKAMYAAIRQGRTPDTEPALPLIMAIRDSVTRNPHALTSVARVKPGEEYAHLHPVAVAALMAAFARRLGMPEEDVVIAALGGLFHDAGESHLPPTLLDKPGKLSGEEFDLMRGHPLQGQRALVAAGLRSRAVLQVIRHHHERYDGTGYPDGLAGEAIPPLARMAAICDVYDALVSNRVHRPGLDPSEALKLMAGWAGQFDQSLFQAFVRSLGVYPVGSLVRLESGHLAVVIDQNPDALLAPKVRVFYSIPRQRPILVYDVDLSDAATQERIASRESPQTWNFRELDKVWMS